MLTSLEVPSPLVQDLTPLRALPGLRTFTGRTTLGYDNQATRDAAVLNSLTKLETINGKSVAQFWKDAEAKQAEFKEWLTLVPTLTAPQQVAAVVAKLKERNPGFGGDVKHRIAADVVTELSFKGENVTDLSPVRALVELKRLICTDGPLSDLSPLEGMPFNYLSLSTCRQVRNLESLKGMPLTTLDLRNCFQVQDLSALKDMPLTYLNLYGCNRVQDLEPLRGMPLTFLYLRLCNKVEDISPLTGLPLSTLSLNATQVKDFSPLKGMPLTRLELDSTHLRDLELLKGMPLKVLQFVDTKVTDLAPLQGMELEEIRLTPKSIIQGLQILRDMKSLKTIGIAHNQSWLVAEFWERYDKGEFKE